MKKKLNKYINAVGVELEGGWKAGRRSGGKISGYLLKGDSSVRDIRMDITGEVNSLPMSKMRSIRGYFKYAYPDRTNDSCGLHIHLSFNSNQYYSKLMSSKFYYYFIREMGKYASTLALIDDRVKFHHRLAGRNRYCRKEFEKSNYVYQVTEEYPSVANRYNIINYSYREFKTIEFRVFPMFSKWQVSYAVSEKLIELVTNYLKKCKPVGWHSIQF